MKRLYLMLLFVVAMQGFSVNYGFCEDAKEKNNFATGGFTNGRGWNSMSEEMQLTYVIGIREGIAYGTKTLLHSGRVGGCEKEIVEVTLGHGLDIPNVEIMNILTNFYKDSANLSIRVLNALLYTDRKLSGATGEELDKLVSALRANSN